MKTPRLSLALLALALAPFASAADRALPTWKIVEEGHRSWPDVRFSVGNDRRSLECRYNECNPAINKGLSNLYRLTKTEAFTPTTVTIYKAVPRSKWNPAYHYDGPYEMVPEKINAKAWSWKSELSHFKLDNTGGKLFVVQGANRYPATTDIDEVQISGYDQMKVAPPAKMSDDEIKPAAPPAQRSTWWCDQNTGEIIGVPAGQKPPAGYTSIGSGSSTCGKKPAPPANPAPSREKLPTAGKWKDSITAVGEWRAIQTSVYPVLGIPLPAPTMTFYCYHEKMDGDKDLATHLKKHPIIVECVNWSKPTDDASQADGTRKYKVRNNHVQFDLSFVNGKLKTMSGVKGVIVKEISPLPDTLGGERYVKVTAPQAAPADGALLLSEKELIWLDRRQGREYAAEKSALDAKPAAEKGAATKALAEKNRKLVVENLAPNTAASSAYAAAAADPKATPESIDKTLPAQVWGGPNDAIVPEFGPRTEIQLSKEDWEVLSKEPPAKPEYTAALEAYRKDWKPANGQVGQSTDYQKNYYDPIVLHRLSEAARKVLGTSAKPPVGTTPAKDPRTILTPAEIALLTPEELRIYKGFLDRATKDGKLDPTDNNLLTNAELLRNRMNNEVPPRSKAPAAPSSDDMTAEQFEKMPLFQKRQFCKDYPPDPVTAQGDTNAPPIDNANPDALKGAQNSAVVTPKPKPAETPAKDTAWPRKARQDACAKLPSEVPGQIDGSAGTGGKNPAVVPTPGLGVDVENKEKEKSKWLTQDLLTSAAKGAMVGLLVGSLFGPVGLVAGPLLGGALFYGLTKITS